MNRNALTPELEADKPPFSDNMLPVFYKQTIGYRDCLECSKNASCITSQDSRLFQMILPHMHFLRHLQLCL